MIDDITIKGNYKPFAVAFHLSHKLSLNTKVLCANLSSQYFCQILLVELVEGIAQVLKLEFILRTRVRHMKLLLLASKAN